MRLFCDEINGFTLRLSDAVVRRVRRNRRLPCFASSAAMRLLTATLLTFNPAAAAVNEAVGQNRNETAQIIESLADSRPERDEFHGGARGPHLVSRQDPKAALLLGAKPHAGAVAGAIGEGFECGGRVGHDSTTSNLAPPRGNGKG